MLRFEETGYLPPGKHKMTLSKLEGSILIKGDDLNYDWNETWRRFLFDNLKLLVHPLWEVGVTDIFIDGSFCTIKNKPDDIDGFYSLPIPPEIEELTNPEEKRQAVLFLIYEVSKKLDAITGYPIWNLWSGGRPDSNGKIKSEMWHRFRCEIYPDCWSIYAGKLDHNGKRLKFEDFFSQDRDGIPKGMIHLVKG